MFIPFEINSAGKVVKSQCQRYKGNASFSLSQINSSELENLGSCRTFSIHLFHIKIELRFVMILELI